MNPWKSVGLVCLPAGYGSVIRRVPRHGDRVVHIEDARYYCKEETQRKEEGIFLFTRNIFVFMYPSGTLPSVTHPRKRYPK